MMGSLFVKVDLSSRSRVCDKRRVDKNSSCMMIGAHVISVNGKTELYFYV